MLLGFSRSANSRKIILVKLSKVPVLIFEIFICDSNLNQFYYNIQNIKQVEGSYLYMSIESIVSKVFYCYSYSKQDFESADAVSPKIIKIK